MSNSELAPIHKLTIPPAPPLSLPPIAGIAFEKKSKLHRLPEIGQAYVEMNSAGHIRVPRERIGQIFTTALAGCTGIAAIAKTEGDTLAGISHFDALVDGDPRQRTNGACASESFMNFFMKIGEHIGAQAFEFHIAYATMHETEAIYGARDKSLGEWHFLDQLQTFAERSGTDVVFHKYEGMGAGHTLLANVALGATTSIEFEQV